MAAKETAELDFAVVPSMQPVPLVSAEFNQLEGALRQTRELMQFVDNARDAALLVRRANAVEELVDEALKSCRLLEEEQFQLKQDAAESLLRTQRLAGQLIQKLEKHAGGRPPVAGGPTKAGRDKPQTLRELGISSHESHRWQRIASLPNDRFEGYITDSRSARRELTTTAVLALANRLRSDDEDHPASTHPSARAGTLAEYLKQKAHVQNLIWIDPALLVAVMSEADRREGIATINRLRRWLDDFEGELRQPHRS